MESFKKCHRVVLAVTQLFVCCAVYYSISRVHSFSDASYEAVLKETGNLKLMMEPASAYSVESTGFSVESTGFSVESTGLEPMPSASERPTQRIPLPPLVDAWSSFYHKKNASFLTSDGFSPPLNCRGAAGESTHSRFAVCPS